MKMLKPLVISIFLTSFITISSVSAEETKRDCEAISTKTLVGQYDKWRCKSGAPERKKFSLKNLNPFKKNKD
jgi:hypothetical protein